MTDFWGLNRDITSFQKITKPECHNFFLMTGRETILSRPEAKKGDYSHGDPFEEQQVSFLNFYQRQKAVG